MIRGKGVCVNPSNKNPLFLLKKQGIWFRFFSIRVWRFARLGGAQEKGGLIAHHLP